MQKMLFEQECIIIPPFRTQLLKWVGNKQRFAHEIASYFPHDFQAYYEPFLGSGAVLATLSPKRAIASDIFPPLVEIWQTLHDSPETLKQWYAERWEATAKGDKIEEYERIKASYNQSPNGADLLFLCRSCYGGVVRFRKADGYMSTPCGIHNPIHPFSFSKRVDQWYQRTKGTSFRLADYREMMRHADPGDLIYCDPPYAHSQGILYGAQSFNLSELLDIIDDCKKRGVFVALSIDGKKKSGQQLCDLPIPDDLFEREIFLNCGASMLKRFQMEGKTLDEHHVADRLLLTY
ncbi:MAG: DNA adenine methylase [Sedimentisphaerales bacterium]|nr:DNA adenine methylase [Sedimentisphaerales bacterium]